MDSGIEVEKGEREGEEGFCDWEGVSEDAWQAAGEQVVVGDIEACIAGEGDAIWREESTVPDSTHVLGYGRI